MGGRMRSSEAQAGCAGARRRTALMWRRCAMSGDTNERRWRQRPAEGLGLTALLSNAPPGARTGPPFRFTQIGRRKRDAAALETVACCHTLVCFHVKSRQTADKQAEFHFRVRGDRHQIQTCPSTDTKTEEVDASPAGQQKKIQIGSV